MGRMPSECFVRLRWWFRTLPVRRHELFEDLPVRLAYSRHVVDHCHALGSRRVYRTGGSTSLAIGDVFEVAEIEEPVLSDGPTDGAAEPILIKPLPVGNALPLEAGIQRIQVSILEIVVDSAMKFICAGLGNNVECAAELCPNSGDIMF